MIAAMLTIKGVAEKLGVSERTVKRLLAARSLPVTKVGARSVRIAAEAVDRYVKKLTTPAVIPGV